MSTFTLESFKDLVQSSQSPFKTDVVDMENGKMTINRCNIDRYLEEYACKDEEDLDNTLYRSFGVWLNIVD